MNGFEHARVGTTLMVLRGNCVLLGKRKGSHGQGEYAFPGGHLDYGETLIDTIYRELKEECGPDLKIKQPYLSTVSDLLTYLPKHYVDIGFVAEWESGEPVVMEPNKCEGWGWYDMDNLPSPLFALVEPCISAFKHEQNYLTVGK